MANKTNHSSGSTQKKFQISWLEIDDYKIWLKRTPDDPYSCMCSICNVKLSCGKSELKKHNDGKKHRRILSAKQHMLDTKELLKNMDTGHNAKVKIAEIKLVLFFACHNIAIHLIDTLVPLLKTVFDDSKIAAEIKLGRTKATDIINNVICKYETDKLVEYLQNNRFSILVDETTDISCTKKMCILTRFLMNGRIITRLLELLTLDAKDCSAQKLYEALKNCFNKYKIPINNIIGVASDGANVMIGQMNSFFSHLKQDVPNAIWMRFICHSSAIIASKACEKLPRTPEELIRGILNYVTGSAKRCAILQEIQQYFVDDQKKLLKLANTRWLCLHQCVVRILDNWIPLTHYFELALYEDKIKSAETILAELKTPCTKAYFYFMKYVLNYFNTFNALFQSNVVLIHKLSDNSLLLLKQLCQNYMDTAVVLEKDLGTINLSHPSYFKDLNNVYLGPECQDMLNLLSQEEIYHLRKNCLNFYICAAAEIQKRLPIQNTLFTEMKFLDPTVALNAKNNDAFNFNHLPAIVPECNKTDLTIEWRNLPFSYNEDEKTRFADKNIEEVWFEISKAKNFNEELMFPNLSKVANFVLCLPHSNAEAERIFSIVTDVKTKKRNKIGDDTLNSICVVRSSINNKSANCVTYEIKKECLKLHNVMMYKHKN